VVKCDIEFSGNYETQNKPIRFSEVANATQYNCDDFTTKFLESIAANRAFIRCVRNFLNIHIVGADEIDKNSASKPDFGNVNAASFTPQATLEKRCKGASIQSFDEFKDFLRKAWSEETYRNEDAKNWSSYEDIPPKDARTLISLVVKSSNGS
jgi:hypothetical protein